MDIRKIWHPKYGVFYDAQGEMKRTVYEREEQGAFIEGGGRCAIGASQYRCSACRRELLV